MLRFWLDKGIDGFRLDAISQLVEVEKITGNNETRSENSDVTDPQQYEYLYHNLTENLQETYDVIRGWKEVLDSYDEPK